MALTLLGTTMIVMAIGQTALVVPDCLMPVLKSAIRFRSSRPLLTKKNLHAAASQPAGVFYAKLPPSRFTKLFLGKKSTPTVSLSSSSASSVASSPPASPPRSILKTRASDTNAASSPKASRRSIRWREEKMPSASETKATRTMVEQWRGKVILEEDDAEVLAWRKSVRRGRCQ